MVHFYRNVGSVVFIIAILEKRLFKLIYELDIQIEKFMLYNIDIFLEIVINPTMANLIFRRETLK